MNSIKWLEGITFLLLMLTVVSTWKWQRCVKVALVIVVFEGAIRKWFLPGLSQFVYFGKDFILLVAYFKFFSGKDSRERTDKPDPLLTLFTRISVAIICLQAANINLGSPIIGIMGVRNYIIYLPLMYMCRYLFKSEEELATFLKWYVPLCLPVVVLATLQYLSPPGSPINVYVAAEETSQALIGDRVRATGTFSYIAGFGVYLQTMAAFIIPLLIIKHEKKWEFLFKLSLGAVAAGIVLSGSRGVLVFSVIFVLFYFVMNKTFRKLGLYRRFLVPTLVIGIAGAAYFSDVLISYSGRFTSNNDLFMRIIIIFTTPLDYISEAGIFGYGAGATYQANARIREIFGLPEGAKIPVYYEGEPERIMLGLGPFGFFAWYALRYRIVLLLWKTYSKLKRPLLRELALTACITHILALPSQVVFQVTFNIYYWFMASFIFLLPRIEYLENERQKEDEMRRKDLNTKKKIDMLSRSWNAS